MCMLFDFIVFQEIFLLESNQPEPVPVDFD